MKTILPEAHLPTGARLSVWRQSGWITLDRRDGLREGCLAEARGVDPRALPGLATLPMPKRTAHAAITGKPLTLCVIDGTVYAVTEEEGTVTLWRTRGGEWQSISLGTADPTLPRVLLPYTFYNYPNDPFNTTRNFPMVLIFPDGYYVRPDEEELSLYPIYQQTDGTLPRLTAACVTLSRVFGVGGDCAYASEYNRVTKWNYDTADDVSSSHAWVTTSQAGGEAGAGAFTAIVPFSGLILAFKERTCQMIAGTKNPFRIADLLPVGTADARTVAHVGPYLIFADRRQVFRFDGSDVREIGTPLGNLDLTGAIAAGAGGLYYLYVPTLDRLFTYATDTGAWCELYPFTSRPVAAMAATADGEVLFVDEAGEIYSTAGAEEVAFSVETSHIVPTLPAPARLLRLRLTFVAEAGASLSLSVRLSDGRVIPLCTVEGDGRTQRKSVRIPAAADTASALCLAGRGKVSVKSVDLVTAETATDGT